MKGDCNVVEEVAGTTTATGPQSNLKNDEAEKKVGMSLCINKKKFQGIIKQRFSDFMVRELDLGSREPVYLTCTDHADGPKKRNQEKVTEIEDLPCPIEDEALVKKIEDFAKNESEETLSDQITFVNNDKESRKLCHLYIKTKYTNLGREESYDLLSVNFLIIFQNDFPSFSSFCILNSKTIFFLL